MEVTAVVAALALAFAVALGLWLRGAKWKTTALRERTKKQQAEADAKKRADLKQEKQRTDKEALEKWRNNFHE